MKRSVSTVSFSAITDPEIGTAWDLGNFPTYFRAIFLPLVTFLRSVLHRTSEAETFPDPTALYVLIFYLRMHSVCSLAVFVLLISSLPVAVQGRPFFSISSSTSSVSKDLPNRHLPHYFYSKTSTSMTASQQLSSIRGGQSDSNLVSGNAKTDSAAGTSSSFRDSVKRNVLGVWGVLQVVSILANAIKRLLPIALQPFQQNDISGAHWAMMLVWCVIMGYSEGYRAFQLKFSPMVVSRAFALPENPSVLNYLLAGPYSMGMFNADRKRMIVAWAVSAGVFSLVKVVKYLPYPYRSIVDAGVVVGLSYGAASLLIQTLHRLFSPPALRDASNSDVNNVVSSSSNNSDKKQQ